MDGHETVGTETRSIYIAGPMTGIEEYNYPLFNLVAKTLRLWGFEVVNPAELQHNEDPEADVSRAEYMVLDLPYVIACDVLVLLPGWGLSLGTNIELFVALVCGRAVWELVQEDEESAVFVVSDARPNLWAVHQHIETAAQA